MATRIAQELFRASVLHEPCHRSIGEGEGREHGFVSPEIGPEGAIQLEDGLGGKALEPEGLGAGEGSVVKFRTPVWTEAAHHGSGDGMVGERQARAGREIGEVGNGAHHRVPK